MGRLKAGLYSFRAQGKIGVGRKALVGVAPPVEQVCDVDTLRPNAPGDFAQFFITGGSPAPTNWESVDEAIPDEDVTLVRGYGATLKDLYNIDNPTFPDNAVISSVTLYNRSRRIDATYYKGWFGIKSGGSEYWGDFVTLTASHATYNRVYTTDPATGEAWTKAAIAALQIGERCPYDGPNQGMFCTQTYVEVAYCYIP